ncbi:MAG: hypothetical protein HYY59_00375 [Candidatus Omnitrophica bacterium]|nr:hypothetical protein [Candidatus Omnitrophota bacterium]MBI3020446.1 hypothetical protein [Candidatus Omnitrophota bacterium]
MRDARTVVKFGGSCRCATPSVLPAKELWRVRASGAPAPRHPPNSITNASLILSLCVVFVSLLAPDGRAEEELRDPFTFGPRVEAVTKVVKPAGPVLMGILWDATRPLAIVGEETVAAGDTVAGWRVVRILEGHIVIQRGERRETMTPGGSIPLD